MLRELRGILSATWKPLALAGGLALIDALWEPTRLKVVRVDLPADGHSDRLVGLRVAQLSDLHVGGEGLAAARRVPAFAGRGHSHGGQIRLPLLASVASNLHARTKYVSGLYRVNGNPLYVTPGLGVSGIPLRFRNRPELTIFRFVPAVKRAETV